MGRVKGSRVGAGKERRKQIFFLPSPSPLSFFHPRTYRKGYYFYSPQSSTVIKSKMAATTILRTRTRFRPPKIRLHCRLTFIQRENRLHKNPLNGHKSARGPHRRDVTTILRKVSCFFSEILSFSQVTETIGFFPFKSLYFECYATMPMLADAHISSLGYL